MLHGTTRLFTGYCWTWSQASNTWFEGHRTKGPRPNEMEQQHFDTHRKRPLDDPSTGVVGATGEVTLIAVGAEEVRWNSSETGRLTIEALQASLADKERLLAESYEHRTAMHRAPAGVGGTYRLRTFEEAEKSDLLDPTNLPNFDYRTDSLTITWSENARLKFRLTSHHVIDQRLSVTLPRTVHADSWWHVCAQVGLIEPMARLMYHHPEDGQEPTVAKAKPVQRGPIITCQGDYWDGC